MSKLKAFVVLMSVAMVVMAYTLAKIVPPVAKHGPEWVVAIRHQPEVTTTSAYGLSDKQIEALELDLEEREQGEGGHVIRPADDGRFVRNGTKMRKQLAAYANGSQVVREWKEDRAFDRETGWLHIRRIRQDYYVDSEGGVKKLKKRIDGPIHYAEKRKRGEPPDDFNDMPLFALWNR